MPDGWRVLPPCKQNYFGVLGPFVQSLEDELVA